MGRYFNFKTQRKRGEMKANELQHVLKLCGIEKTIEL